MNRYSPPASTDSSTSMQVSEAVHEVIVLPSEMPAGLSRPARIVLGIAGSVLITLLAIAASLTPNPNGFGTHRQIRLPILGTEPGGGLPACSFMEIYKRPCPSCGMTTSWSWLMHGNLIAASKANIAGLLLGICALTTGPWMFVSAIRGRWFLGYPSDRTILLVGGTLIVFTIGHWVFRLIYG